MSSENIFNNEGNTKDFFKQQSVPSEISKFFRQKKIIPVIIFIYKVV
jgi:hypothetical protein